MEHGSKTVMKKKAHIMRRLKLGLESVEYLARVMQEWGKSKSEGIGD